MTDQPLVVIVGPTASGKSALTMQIAEQFNGEIICADSRTVYRGMDIGTAKPTASDQAQIAHWGLDLVSPDERFTAADFKHYATGKISEIRARGKLPFMVGGTGLYIDGVIFDYQFSGQFEPERRRQLEQMTHKDLTDYCVANNIELPKDQQNKRRLVGAIERQNISGMRSEDLINNCIVAGITTDRSQLGVQIEQRIEQMFDQGVVEEAILLGKNYNQNSPAMTGNIYQTVLEAGERDWSADVSDVIQKAAVRDRQLAKRQMTWFQRNPYIVWGTLEEQLKQIANRLTRL